MLSPYLIHTLGDTKYGVWSVVSALTGYMSLLDLGISSAVAKYVAKYKALNDYRSINVVIGSSLVVLLTVAALLILVGPLLASGMVNFFDFDGELGRTVHALIIVASIDIAIFVCTGVLMGAYFGFQRFEVTNAVNLSVGLFKALAFYLALSNGLGLFAMGIVSLLGNILAAILLFATMRKIEPKVKLQPQLADKKTIKSIYDYSKYTFITMFAMQLVYYSDAFVIGYFLTAAAITIYTIPWSLSEYTNKLILAIAQTFVPVFSDQDATQGNAAIYRTYVTGTKFILLVSNLLCIGMLAVGDHFVGIWMGPKYAVECSVILSLLFVTQLIKGPQLLSYSILLGTSNHRKYAMYNFGFSVVNLFLSIMLVQRYGLVGVAIGTALTQITFFGIVTPILASRAIDSNMLGYFKETYLRIVPSSLLLYFLLKYFSSVTVPESYLTLLLQALGATVVYLISTYYLLLDSGERTIVLSGVQRLLAKFLNRPKAA